MDEMSRKEKDRQAEYASEIEDILENETTKNVSYEEAQSAERLSSETPKTRAEVLREKDENRKKNEERTAQVQKLLSKESAIESVRRTRRILTGRIIGCDEIPADELPIVCASVLVGNAEERTKMNVRFEDLIVGTSPLDMSTVNLNSENGKRRLVARQKQILTKMIGLEIPVCITQVIKDYDGQGNNLIFASRKDACENIRNRAYFGRNPSVIDGETYNATIISVSPHSVAVSLYGVDFVINQNTLSRRYLTDLQLHYKVGDKLAVKIHDMKLDGEKRTVKFSPDTLTPELEDCKKRWNLVAPGTIANATVSQISKQRNTDRIAIYAWMDSYDLACRVQNIDANSFGRAPISGDKIQIVVSGFQPNGYVTVRCKALHGNAGIFNNF